MLVPVMLLRTGCETAARELQGRLRHFPKMRLFTQRLVRAYVSFDKASEQIHSVLYAFLTGVATELVIGQFLD
jgi:hypothetical protein